MRSSTLLTILLSTFAMATPTPSPQDASIQPFPNPKPFVPSKPKQADPPRPNVAQTQSCSGAAMSKVMWWTNGPAGATASSDAEIQKQIDTVGDAVTAAGGQIAGKINIGKMRGLTLIAPTKMLDLVAQLGKDLGFQMEVDGTASISSPSKQPVTVYESEPFDLRQ